MNSEYFVLLLPESTDSCTVRHLTVRELVPELLLHVLDGEGLPLVLGVGQQDSIPLLRGELLIIIDIHNLKNRTYICQFHREGEKVRFGDQYKQNIFFLTSIIVISHKISSQYILILSGMSLGYNKTNNTNQNVDVLDNFY